jgi:protein transport protein SEC13
MLSHEHVSAAIDGSSFSLPPRRFVSAGCDGKIKFWYSLSKDGGKFVMTKEILAHEDWVRDVAWSPNLGLAHDVVASCSEDQRVKLWKRNAGQDPSKDEWNLSREININTPAWKVSWSHVGGLLAVSGGDNQVTVYKE